MTSEVRELQRTLVEVRADLIVTQAALATVMAEVARMSPQPAALIGDMVTQLMGFAESAARGLGPDCVSRAPALTASAHRVASWAEALLGVPELQVES
jgi:predicted regulator of Ras-like GTPase activity (Roadblock/LC7/MglB family)